MKSICAGVFLMVILLHGPAAAEIYKYTDADGILRFTNDINQVPEAQRKQMTTYDEVVSTAADQEARAQRSAAQDQIIKDSQAEKDAAAVAGLKNRASQLKNQQADLKAEAEALKKAREELGPPPSRSASAARHRIYNQKVQEFNQKNSAHQQKLNLLQEEMGQLVEDAGDQAADIGLEP